jgi:hypothetical protein
MCRGLVGVRGWQCLYSRLMTVSYWLGQLCCTTLDTRPIWPVPGFMRLTVPGTYAGLVVLIGW